MKTRKKIQLFCLPFAGGSKAIFKNFQEYIAEEIEIVLIEYPGHDSRISEAFCEEIEELVEDVLEQIIQKRNKNLPFAILGYSMGSVLAYELLSRIYNFNISLIGTPVHLFLCAIEALSNFKPRIDFKNMERQKAIEILTNMGGIENNILKNERFLEVFLRPIKADYELLSNYRFSKKAVVPKVDGSIIFSNEDTPYYKVEDWKYLINGDVEFYEMGNNHFFINQCSKDLAELINGKLLDCVKEAN